MPLSRATQDAVYPSDWFTKRQSIWVVDEMSSNTVWQEELATMNQAVEQVLSRRKKQKPALIFPFSLLDRLINAGLLSLERLVRRLVTIVVL